MPRVQTLPIRVLMDRDLSGVNRDALKESVDEWNRFGRASLGIDFFKIDESGTADYSRFKARADYCSFGSEMPAGLVVVSEDSSSAWTENLAVEAEARGLTRRCSMGDGTAQSRQIVVVNSAETDVSQRKTVILHELGHVIGLQHSCVSHEGNPYFIACSAVPLGSPYRDAVMFPSFRAVGLDTSNVSEDEYKEELRDNDMQRAYCLYQR